MILRIWPFRRLSWRTRLLVLLIHQNDQRVRKIRITRIFQLIGRDQSSLKKKDDNHINCTMMIMWWVPQVRMKNCVLLSPQHLRSRLPADVHFLFAGVVPHQNASLRSSVNLLTSSSHGKHKLKWNRVHAKMVSNCTFSIFFLSNNAIIEKKKNKKKLIKIYMSH